MTAMLPVVCVNR